MLAEKTIDIKLYGNNLCLTVKEEFSQNKDYKEFLSSFKNYIQDKSFKIIEIDFEGNFFEITNLLEGLIKKSYLFRNSQPKVVLTLGKLDLDTRIEYLRTLHKLKIKNYKINYFKK